MKFHLLIKLKTDHARLLATRPHEKAQIKSLEDQIHEEEDHEKERAQPSAEGSDEAHAGRREDRETNPG